MGFNQKAAQRELARLEDQRSKVAKRISVVMDRLQRHCKHEQVVEGYDSPVPGFSAIAPIRVCKDCGYAEEGWGSGFWKLQEPAGGVYGIDRASALRFVRRFLTQDEMNEKRHGRREISRREIFA